ncbi:MAG: Glutathione transport system permease protein GsiC [candidate division TA06 bacterium ADurb.Bin417]|uniref:Glutathione transport system permease protein GsiC n=1 Tax=candidate division TA06 bacterium ADurb.Bin417 TaxID=1852828 RepID=A0A1V5M6D8_UNCT6|nr:MAG: Glutathione transport system permease protein GsiC [candidate division TA06 bacterium ADurb.Bin417]
MSADRSATTQTAAVSAAGRFQFHGRPEPGGGRLLIRPGPGGRVEIRRLTLERRMANPFDSQFIHFLGRVIRLDFGVSLATGQPVLQILREGIGPSLALTVPIFLADLALAIALALGCAYFRNTAFDRIVVVLAVVLMSVNYLVWIVAGQYLLAYRLGAFPVWGASLRFNRTVMLDEMYRDYVRTAFAKGLPLRTVLFRHVLKNALIPILTSVVMAIPFLYTGSLLLESFFGIPGLGYLSVNALNSLDVDVVRAVVLIGTILYILANLVGDLVNARVDPRVRLE